MRQYRRNQPVETLLDIKTTANADILKYSRSIKINVRSTHGVTSPREMIDHYTEASNNCQYRQSYPPISTHNVKIWFKNRLKKCKRIKTGDLNLKMMI
ncbi:hypothetical protein QQG55_55595 [Brugia pahangi]